MLVYYHQEEEKFMVTGLTAEKLPTYVAKRSEVAWYDDAETIADMDISEDPNNDTKSTSRSDTLAMLKFVDVKHLALPYLHLLNFCLTTEFVFKICNGCA